MQNLLDTIWNHGIFVAEKGQNPALYPFFLAGIVLSLILGIVNFAFELRSRQFGFVLKLELKWLLVYELLPLYAVWLAFATPPTRLPFPPPIPNTSWLFIPALPTYTVIAVILHGLLSVCGLVLTVGWLAQFNTPNGSRIDTFFLLITLVGLVIGWELQHWPLTFLIVAEILAVAPLAAQYFGVLIWGSQAAKEAPGAQRVLATYILVNTLAIALTLFWHDSLIVQWYLLAAIVTAFVLSFFFGPAFSKPSASKEQSVSLLVRYLLVSTVLNLVFWLLGVISESTWHVVDPVVLNIAAVFYLLIQFDAVFVIAYGQKFKRMTFLPLLALAVTLIAASGAFVGITHNSGLNYAIWLEGGVAASIFLLFFPLTQLARESFRADQVANHQRRSAGILAAPQAILALPDGSNSLKSSQQTGQANQGGEKIQGSLLPQQPPELAGIQKEYEMLQFQGGIFFLLLGVCYHWIAINPDIFSALNGNLIGLVFAGIAAFTGMLAISVDRDNDTSRAVLLLVLLLTGSLVGADILLNTALPGATLNLANVQAPFNLFTNHQIALSTIRSVVEESLVLLGGGQFFYLIVIVIAFLGRKAAEIEAARTSRPY